MNTGTVSTYLVKYLTQEEEEMEEMENKKQMEKQPERRLLDSGMQRTRWKSTNVEKMEEQEAEMRWNCPSTTPNQAACWSMQQGRKTK